ncbi:MAG: hypothetical protein IT297_04450 [Anaerolineae bacterium]|nr:hypothetical protein [Anaerolineae bacterium]
MKRLHLAALALLTAWALAGCAAAAPTAAAPAAPSATASQPPGETLRAFALDAPFSLPYGAEIQAQDGGLRLSFEAVLEDSRCPEGAQCIWAGQVRAQLHAWADGAAAETFELITSTAKQAPDNAHTYHGYRIELLAVDPYPQSPADPQARLPADYRLTLRAARLP